MLKYYAVLKVYSLDPLPLKFTVTKNIKYIVSDDIKKYSFHLLHFHKKEY